MYVRKVIKRFLNFKWQFITIPTDGEHPRITRYKITITTL